MASTTHSDDNAYENREKLKDHWRHDRRSTQFELLRGLQAGERYPNRPAAYSGNMHLQRKMFGKSGRFCVVKDGFLYIYRSKKEVDKGRIWRKIDLAHSVVSYRKADCVILINTDERNEMHRFKIGRDTFDSWVEHLRMHRLYRQDQFAGEQVLAEPNTPRSPVTELYPGIPQPRVDFSALDGDVDSETSKRRVVEWLLESEKMDIRDKECNEASMLVFELGSIIEQLEKCADVASERHSAESPKATNNRSLFSRLSFRGKRHGQNDQAETGQKPPMSTPAVKEMPTLQIPSSLSTNSFSGGGSAPDVRKLPKSPSMSPSPALKRMSREESDLFHRDTWLREEYLRLAKEAHQKFRLLLRELNSEQVKLKTLQYHHQSRNDSVLDKSADVLSASSASSPVRRPDRSIYKSGDRSVSMNLRRDVLDSKASNDKAAPITARQLDRPATDRTSSSVYYDAGEGPLTSAPTQLSLPNSDLGSSYTPSEIDSGDDGDLKGTPENSRSETSSTTGEHNEQFDEADDGVTRLQLGNSALILPRYRERLPAYMPHAPSFFKLLYNAIGRDFTRFPLPITTMEPLSLLQVLCEELEYNELIDQAAASSDPEMRMVYVAAFAVSRYGSTTYRVGRKPFNPLSGETFEYVSPDRSVRYIAEQVSHHPPISACHAEGRGWTWWQAAEAQVIFGGRSVEARPLSPVFLRLHRWNETYTWNKVNTYLTNLLSGPPFVMDHYGEMVVHCLENDMKCKLHFEKVGKQRGNVAGKVTDVDGRVVHTMFGRWTDSLHLVESEATSRCIWRLAALPPDHERYYGFTRFAMSLNELMPEVHGELPPTDCRYRPDQRNLENGHADVAEKLKKKIESDQRERLKAMKQEDLVLWFK